MTALLALGAVASGAQEAGENRGPASPRGERRVSAEERTAAEQRVIELVQPRLVRRIAPAELAADARHLVQSLSDTKIRQLLDGAELDAVAPKLDQAAADSQLQSVAAAAAALGDPKADLLYVPIAPCRIIDTRSGGGKLDIGVERGFKVTGTDGFEAQGGHAGGCGIPQGATQPAAAAIMLNLVAVDVEGKGNLLAWEYGTTAPLASSINYQNLNMNIANGLIVPITGVATSPFDLSIRASFAPAQVVADVTGYFTRFPVEQFQGSLKSELVSNDFTTLTSLADGGCKELNSCTITTSSPGTVVVEAWAQVVFNHTAGTLDRGAVGIETTATVSCPYDTNSVDASDFEVSAALGSNPDVDGTITHGHAFVQPGGTTQTYRLSGLMTSGAGTGDAVENSRIICTFIPD